MSCVVQHRGLVETPPICKQSVILNRAPFSGVTGSKDANMLCTAP